MTVYPQVPELAAVYTITGPDGTVAVINDQTSGNYVGTFAEDGLTGLDSPDIRENAWELVEADGGVHGNFWLGRRPITLQLTIQAGDATTRGARVEKLKRATRALRGDGTLSWTTPYGGGPNQQVTFRTQQPMRVTGAWAKSVFCGLVCADPRIYSTSLHTTHIDGNGTPVTVTNQGDFNSPPSLKVTGPGTNPTVTNNGVNIKFNSLTLAGGEYIVIDLVQRTIVKSDGTNQYGTLDFLNTNWWYLASGDNNVALSWQSGSTAASDLDISWRDAWV